MDSVEYLTGVAYEAFINLVPNETVRIQDAADIAIELWDVYEGYIEKELGGTDVIYEHEMYYETMTRNDSVIYSFVLDLKVYFKYSHKHNSSNIFLNGLLSLQKKERHFISKSNSTYKMLLGYYDETVISFAPTDPPHKQQLILIRGILSTLYKRKPDIKPTLISKVLGCPLIRDDKHGTVSLKHETDYPPGSLITMNVLGNISVYVCVDDFLSSAAKRYTEQEKSQQSSTDNSVSAQGIMSLVCACISIVCLVLTLVTYAVFPELRTQPGINTIALVICLIAAQSLFQFGSQQSDSLSEWGCQTIGVLIHFFWLMVMFWMNVCSIHMYLVFINIDKITVPKYSLKQTIIYTTYTIMASMIFVIINIVVSIIRSDIEGMGYGGEICYITKYWMIGFVFSLPVGIIVVVNMSLFLAVVIRMWRMPTVKSETKHTRNIFAIFAKLSTLTGITWILGFAYVFTGFTTLEYIFIIFNASQGVFIFLAFVCNKRVLDMYRGFMARTKTCLSGRLTTKKTQTTNFTDIMQKGSHSNMSQGMVNGSVGFPTK